MKKVAFFITSLNSGGIENYLLRFLKYKSRTLTPVIFCKSGNTGELLEKYNAEDWIKIKAFSLGYFNLGNYFTLYKYLNENKFDSVCDFTGNFSGLVLLTAKMAGVKKRIAFYRGSSNHFKETPFRLLYNYFIRQLVKVSATTILSNSEAAFNFFFSKDWRKEKKYKVIYNALNPDDFKEEKSKIEIRKELGLPLDSFIIGHSGRFIEPKNHQTIVSVAKKITNTYNDIVFLFFGKDTENKIPELIGLFETTQIKGLGFRSDVPKLLNALDLFFFPSISEGQPNALIEAMISGIPVIASDIPSIKETVPEYFHQNLLKPLDAEGFEKQIVELYKNPEKLKAHNHKEWAERKFDPDILFEKFFIEL